MEQSLVLLRPWVLAIPGAVYSRCSGHETKKACINKRGDSLFLHLNIKYFLTVFFLWMREPLLLPGLFFFGFSVHT